MYYIIALMRNCDHSYINSIGNTITYPINNDGTLSYTLGNKNKKITNTKLIP